MDDREVIHLSVLYNVHKNDFRLSERFVFKLLQMDRGMAYLVRSLHKGQ
jgi:hypothetical protein